MVPFAVSIHTFDWNYFHVIMIKLHPKKGV